MVRTNRDIGRPPLAEDDESVSVTFRAPGSLIAKAKEKSESIGFYKFGEFLRYCIQAELHKNISEILTEKLNALIRENIELRAVIKGRVKGDKEKKEKKEKKENKGDKAKSSRAS